MQAGETHAPGGGHQRSWEQKPRPRTRPPALGSRARREGAQAFPAKVCTPFLDSRALPPPDRGAEAARAAAGLGAHGRAAGQAAARGSSRASGTWAPREGWRAYDPRRLPAHPAFPAKVGRAAGSRPAPGPAREKSPGDGGVLKRPKVAISHLLGATYTEQRASVSGRGDPAASDVEEKKLFPGCGRRGQARAAGRARGRGAT